MGKKEYKKIRYNLLISFILLAFLLLYLFFIRSSLTGFVTFTAPSPLNNTVLNTNVITLNMTSDITGGTYSLVDFDKSLLLWYRMEYINSTLGVIDNSVYNNNGSAIADVINNSNGKFGRSLLFGNSSYGYIEVNSTQFQNTFIPSFQNHSFTVSAWMYFRDNRINDLPLLAIGPEELKDGSLDMTRRGNKLFLGFWADDLTAADYPSATNLTSGTWWHIAATWDSSTRARILYVNGNFEISDISSGDLIVPNGSKMKIGEFAGNYLNGSIDELLIFNRTLTPYEVSLLYNSTSLYYQNNFSNLSEGPHNFLGYFINSTQTESKSLYLVVDRTNPLISYIQPTPSTGSNISANNFKINLSITEANSINLTFSIFNQTSILNQTLFQTNLTQFTFYNLLDGDYYFNVSAKDIAGNFNTTESRTIRIDTTSPNASLISPANGILSASYSVSFDYNTADNIGIKNITLLIYNSTALINQTTLSNFSNIITSQIGSILASLEDGIYNWSYLVYDWAGNYNLTSNRTLTIAVPPVVSFVSPTTSEGTTVQTYINANVTVNDTNFNSLTINLYNSTSLVNSTFTLVNNAFLVYSNLIYEDYYINATANDTRGNSATLSRRISLRESLPVTSSNTGGGGGSSSFSTFTLSDAELLAGSTRTMSVNDRFKFNFTDLYFLILNSYNAQTNNSVLSLTGQPSTISLLLGESKKINLNRDNYYDILIKFESTSNNKPQISIRKNSELIPPITANQTSVSSGNSGSSADNPLPNPNSTKKVFALNMDTLWLILTSIFVLGIIIVIIVISIVIARNLGNKWQKSSSGTNLERKLSDLMKSI